MPPNLREIEDTRCVNCGLTTKRMTRRQVAQLLPAERQLLFTWLQSYDIPDIESRLICQECITYIQVNANPIQPAQSEAPPPPPRWLGHQTVCATCGISTRDCRKITLDEERYPYLKLLRPYIQHYKEGKADICRKCQLKIKREFENANKPLKMEAVYNEVTMEEQVTEDQVLKTEEVEVNLHNSLDNLTPTVSEETAESVQALPIKAYWKLEVPKKLACALCDGAEVGRLRLKSRQQLLLRHKLYIPSGARVCALHAAPNAAPPPPAPPAARPLAPACHFTAEQIADMLFLLKLKNPVDLGDVDNLAPFTIKKWLGITLENFEEIFNRTPKLRERNDGRFALAVYLAHKHSEECITVLASLCQRPRELVAASVKLAQGCVELNASAKSRDELVKNRAEIEAIESNDEETEEQYYEVETLELSD